MTQKLNGLSIRKLQAIAALCLAQFCRAYNIRHPAIEELVEHLLRLLISNNLPNWDSEGAGLELAGRGDPMPTALEVIIPQPVAHSFRHFVEHAVEVGLVCMYGRTTDEPLKILEQTGVEAPDVDDLFKAESNDSEKEGWGRPVSSTDYERVRARYLTIWQDFG